jgi:hypothetical protein
MNREQILLNIQHLTAEQLFGFIKQGIVTLKDLQNTGELDASKRNAIARLQSEYDKIVEKAWEQAQFGTELDLRNFISEYPTCKHVAIAKELIIELRKQKDKEVAKRKTIINDIRDNIYTPDRVQSYLKDGQIDTEILSNECGLPDDIIDKIINYRPVSISLGETPQSIPQGFTEVYFWGIPTSGKTCALATILNTAHKKGYMQTGEGAGLKYLHTLKNLFKTEDGIGLLPEGTPDKTQYLPFTLKKEKEKYARSVSLIELNGEVFKCFLKKNIGESLGALKETFDTLTSYLQSNNRKIHFFFIDYEPNSIAMDDYTQSDYLDEASKYFTRNKIFSDSTDAIYVVITKSDLIEGFFSKDGRLNENINTYIDKNFKSFDIYLKYLCKKESINGGSYDIIPFSIGNVYCQRICKINRKPSEIIINKLFERIEPQKKSIFDILNK